jgi:CBS domain-containing protein
MSAGVTCTSTAERLAVAGEAGTLGAGDAATLREAYDLIVALRVEHQIGQLREGTEPDDYIDPDRFSSLTRSHLREAFRAVAAVQKRVAADLAVSGW